MIDNMLVNLFGLGDPTVSDLQHAADALVKSGALSAATIRDYFLVLPTKTWKDAGLTLIDRGVSPQVVAQGLQLAKAQNKIPWSTITGALSVASAAVSAYHGARRNNSIAWGLWWFTMGIVFPVVTPVVALSQGFARPKEK